MDNFGSFNSPLSPMRFQSQLGKHSELIHNEGKNIVKLSLARVAKVNYKYNTVEVVTTRYKNNTMKNPNDSGKFSARLPISFGGKTPDGKVYGTNTLVTVGSLVLIGFLEGNKDYPIVLNIYGDADNQSKLTRTTFTGADESDEEIQRELWQLFTLYPSMTYKNIDGNGNQEVTFSGKSFMFITDTDQYNEYVQDYGFEYDHLPSSRYANGEQIEPKSPDAPTVLYVHQGVYSNHRVTFFIKSDGTVRLGSRHNTGQGITFQEMKPDGSFSIIQKDSTANPEEEVEKFSQIGITRNGSIILKSKEHELEINNRGIFHNGRPLGSGGSGGGGGDIPDDIKKQLEEMGKTILEQNATLEIFEGRIRLKADATVLDEVRDKVEYHDAQFVVAFNQITSKVSREEHQVDLEGVMDYADELLADVNLEFDDVYESIASLDEYIDGAFKDGIIEETEAQAIAKYINTLESEKKDLDTKYGNIILDEHLEELQKLDLQAAKDDYDFAHQSLIETINTAIADGRTTPSESAAVNERFEDYATALADLSVSFEAAINNIAFNRSKNWANVEFKRVESEIEQLADRISSTVTSEELTTEIEAVKSEQATVNREFEEKFERVDNEIDAAMAYRSEIVSTNGNIFKNGNVNTTLFCIVHHGNTNVTDILDASQFNWTRVSEDIEGDTVWNSQKGRGKKSVQITREDVVVRATFTCEVSE